MWNWAKPLPPGAAITQAVFSLEALRVVVSIPQQFSQLVRQSRQAEVSLNDGRVLQTGEMTFFFPMPIRPPTALSVRMSLDEPKGSLFPGMLVQVRVPGS